MDIARELKSAIKTGKVVLGYRQAYRELISGRAKMIILASNARDDIRDTIERYCKLSGTPLYVFPGSSWDLGALSGRLHTVSVLAILDPGDSSIMDLVISKG